MTKQEILAGGVEKVSIAATLALDHTLMEAIRSADGDAMDDRPLWSRCSLGKTRWYWVVFRSFDDIVDQAEPIATGFALSSADCFVAASKVAPQAVMFNTSLASQHHRKLCVLRRMNKPASNSKGAVQQQYLYTDHDKDEWWDGSGDWLYSQPHRVIKVTKNSVFVEKDSWRGYDFCRGYEAHKYRLDRHELEATGEIWSHQARCRFYTRPYEERRPSHRPQYLADLDLPAGASQSQIRSQFRRLAKIHHPDCGGDAEVFKRILAAYEKAIDDTTL